MSAESTVEKLLEAIESINGTRAETKKTWKQIQLYLQELTAQGTPHPEFYVCSVCDCIAIVNDQIRYRCSSCDQRPLCESCITACVACSSILCISCYENNDIICCE